MGPVFAKGGAIKMADGGNLPDAPWETGSQGNDLPAAPWESEEPSVGADIAKSAGVGAAKGLINASGTLGDTANLLTKGSKIAGDYIGGLFGAAPSPEPKYSMLPTSGAIQNAIEQQTGKFYEPQTTAGKFTGAIAETAANPMSYIGPGGIPAKLIGAAATGAGSEGAGELAQKYAPEAEPYARFAGGLFGGAAAGQLSASAANTMRARGISTTQDLHNAADAAYDSARNLGVEYQPNRVADLRDDIERTLIQEGHRDDALSGGTFARVRELGNSAAGANPDFSDIESVRKSLNRVRKQVNPATGGPTEDARAASIAIDHIDDFFEDPNNAIPSHRGLAQQAAQFAAEGRGNWGAMARSEQVEQALQRSQRNAAATGSGANFDNAARQQIKNILNNPRRARNFTADDRQIMEDLVAGNPVRNSARLISKLAATGIVSATGTLALGHLMGLGPAGAAFLPALGYAGKKVAEAGTRGRYQRLLENIRMDSPLGQANPVPPRRSALPFVARSAATMPYRPFQNNPIPPSSANPYVP
jgi:hypothetical protein